MYIQHVYTLCHFNIIGMEYHSSLKKKKSFDDILKEVRLSFRNKYSKLLLIGTCILCYLNAFSGGYW